MLLTCEAVDLSQGAPSYPQPGVARTHVALLTNLLVTRMTSHPAILEAVK